jgi:thioredoxin 1
MSAQKINAENFDSLLTEARPVLLDFYADWCGPCRMVAPVLEEIAAERRDVLVGKVNVDEEPELASKFGVFSIPTLVVLKDGKEKTRAVGAKPKEQLIALLNG